MVKPIKIDEALHNVLKIRAVHENCTMGQIIERAVASYIKDNAIDGLSQNITIAARANGRPSKKPKYKIPSIELRVMDLKLVPDRVDNQHAQNHGVITIGFARNKMWLEASNPVTVALLECAGYEGGMMPASDAGKLDHLNGLPCEIIVDSAGAPLNDTGRAIIKLMQGREIFSKYFLHAIHEYGFSIVYS